MNAHTRAAWQERFDRLRPDGRMFIEGRRCGAKSGERFTRTRPMDGIDGYEAARGMAADVDAAVASARRAFEDKRWRGLEPLARKEIMLKWANLVRANAEELALLETYDVGKPIGDTFNVDIPSCARTLQFYGETIDKLYDEVAPTGPNDRAIIKKEPLGLVGVITPWNYPLIIDAWKLGAALAAGNSVVLKPAEQSSLGALRLAELAMEAGLPAGVVNVVTGYGHEAGKPLALHDDVAMIAFTGSTVIGRTIMGYAAQSNGKRVALELGGKSPVIVFADGDLDAAASAIAWGCFYNSGQTCHASTRVIVERSVQDALVEKIGAIATGLKQGHPLDPATQIGALVEEEHMGKVLGLIGKGHEEGASLRLGGNRVLTELGGYYVEPTIFADASNAMSISREEIFGPVLTSIPFDSDDEALAMANDTIYGLAAGVFTSDMTRAHHFSEDIQAGTVWINAYDLSNLATPFGGFKQSGFGRDRSVHAIDKYMDYKTVWQRFL